MTGTDTNIAVLAVPQVTVLELIAVALIWAPVAALVIRTWFISWTILSVPFEELSNDGVNTPLPLDVNADVL